MLLLLLAMLSLSQALAEPLKFIVVGDWGTGDSSQQAVADQMAVWAADNDPAFILSTGDNFYSDGLVSPNDPRVQERWYAMYNHPALRDLSWYITVGNHDYSPTDSGREWNQVLLAAIEPRWILPDLWHKATFESPSGPVQIILLDSQALRKKVNDWRDQLPFLEEALQDPDVTYNLVAAHHPVHTAARYGPGSGTMRDYIQPIMEQHGADVFFCGHDHNIQHLRRRDGVGPDYVLSGGGGRGLYSQDMDATRTLEQEGIDLLNFTYNNGFVAVVVDETGMHFDYIDRDGRTVYSFTRPAKK